MQTTNQMPTIDQLRTQVSEALDRGFDKGKQANGLYCTKEALDVIDTIDALYGSKVASRIAEDYDLTY